MHGGATSTVATLSSDDALDSMSGVMPAVQRLALIESDKYCNVSKSFRYVRTILSSHVDRAISTLVCYPIRTRVLYV